MQVILNMFSCWKLYKPNSQTPYPITIYVTVNSNHECRHWYTKNKKKIGEDWRITNNKNYLIRKIWLWMKRKKLLFFGRTSFILGSIRVPTPWSEKRMIFLKKRCESWIKNCFLSNNHINGFLHRTFALHDDDDGSL